LEGQQTLNVVILLACGHDASGDQFAREATVVAGRAAATLGGNHELIDLSGGQVVAVVHRFV